MTKLNIGDAAFAGFRLIGRHPVAPLVWGLVRTVLVVAPMLLALPVFRDMLTVLTQAQATGRAPALEEVMALNARFGLYGPVSWLLSIAATALIAGAVFRAVLTPSDKGFFFLRLGMGEVMLAVLGLVFAIGLMMTAGACAMVIGILAVVVGYTSENAGIAVAVIFGLAFLAVLIWVCLRLSIAGPMTFQARTLALTESWTATRGNSGRLLLVALILLLMIWIAEAIIGGLLVAIILPRMPGLADGSADVVSLLPTLIRTAGPVLLGFGAAACLASGYLSTILLAPFADVASQLAPSEAA